MNQAQRKDLDFLCCPDCRGPLEAHRQYFQCRSCRGKFEVIDGIVDLYPKKNLFTPQNTDLKNVYESCGESSTLPDSFQYKRRKRLTLEFVEGNTILEIGASEGWMTKELTQKADTVVCCDIALNYLKRVKEKGIQASFFRIDVHSLPFQSGYFDCVVMTEVLEHLYSPYRALEEIHRVLSPRGIFVLSVPNTMTPFNILQNVFLKNFSKKDLHFNFYDVYALTNLLWFTGFSVQKMKPAFIFLPVLKPLFYSDVLQKVLSLFFKNFGDKLIVKAVKSDRSFWDPMDRTSFL